MTLRCSMMSMALALLAANSVCAFHQPLTSRAVRSGTRVMRQAAEVPHLLDAAQHAFEAANVLLADAATLDAADASPPGDPAAVVETVAETAKAGGFTMPSLPQLPSPPDLWTPWRNFVQSSIVQLHSALYAAGVKQNTYGFSIIAFTLLCRLITFPLTYIQYSSTEKMKALQPYTEEIKSRYPDQRTQNFMIAKLYEDTESNPLAGCLPSLLQIPVFIALYRSLLNLANDNTLQESFFFLPSLEGPTITDVLQLPQGRGIDWLTTQWSGSITGGDLAPLLGWSDTIAYCALPLLLVLTQSATMSAMAPPVDTEDATAMRTQRILKFLPLMLGYFSLCVPSGLAVYWMTSNVAATSVSLGVKAYFKANPPEVEWDFLEEQAKQGLNDAALFSLDLPANMEEALVEARINARPPRIPRRVTA